MIKSSLFTIAKNKPLYHKNIQRFETLPKPAVFAREWILELVYAIGLEERKNERGTGTVQLHILDFDDEWKL